MPDEWEYRTRGLPPGTASRTEREGSRHRADDARRGETRDAFSGYFRDEGERDSYRGRDPNRDRDSYRGRDPNRDRDPYRGGDQNRGKDQNRGGSRARIDTRRDARPSNYDARPDAWPGQPPPGARRRPPARSSGRWGSMPFRDGVTIMIASALLGIIATMVAGGQPGALLGLIVIAGAVAASTAVPPRASYLFIPLPSLTYLVSAMLAGVLGGASAGTSRTALALAALQWLAHGFVWMVAATLAAGIIAGIRLFREVQGRR